MNGSGECSCAGRSAITGIESQFRLIGHNRKSLLKHQVKYGKLPCKPYGLRLRLNVWLNGCGELGAHAASGAGADRAGGGFFALEGEVVFLLKEGFLDAVVDEVPGKCFVQVFGPVCKEIGVEF
jgi:hypothetical protein